jgi:hypothetical protein
MRPRFLRPVASARAQQEVSKRIRTSQPIEHLCGKLLYALQIGELEWEHDYTRVESKRVVCCLRLRDVASTKEHFISLLLAQKLLDHLEALDEISVRMG